MNAWEKLRVRETEKAWEELNRRIKEAKNACDMALEELEKLRDLPRSGAILTHINRRER